MATTTPNFGWPVPTSSDLVKNGATAIESLGDAVDASLLDLKGGTTGQVLAKASGTDMDFTWTTSSAGMTNPMTTTGDTIYSSSGSTPARLGIGSTGQVLTVSGGVPSWATPSATASGLTKVTSASFSGVANTGTTFDGVFTSTYNNYLVVMSNIVGSSSASLYFQWRKSGPTTHTVNYYGNRLNDGVNTATTNASQNTLMLLESEASHLTMNVAIDATPTQMSYIGAQRLALDALSGSGTNDTLGANTATGFILSSSSGNIGGFIAVYGLAD